MSPRNILSLWRRSFRFKLILITILSITLTVGVYSVVIYWRHAQAAESAQKERAERLAGLMAESLAHPMYEFNTVAVTAGVKALESHADIRRVRVIDSSGNLVVERGDSNQSTEILLTIRHNIMHDTGKKATQVGTIELAFSRSALDAELYRSLYETLIGGALMAIVTILAALWTFRSLTKPLTEIIGGLDQLAAGKTAISLPAVNRTDEFGRMANAMHRFRDAITERKRAEQAVRDNERRYLEELEDTVAQRTAQLAEAKEAAEAASLAKSSFVANMSHEIRTPLNAVLGLAKIIVREDKGRRSGETGARILEAGEHLLGVINDILDFSKIEAGKLLIDAQPFELARLVEKTAGLVRDRASAKNLKLHTDLSKDLPLWVCGDALRIEQILINLLSNAIKFTELGGVTISVSRVSGMIQFRIADTGIGMTPEQSGRLFQPFEQADSSTTRKFGGTGLGLAISRNLTIQMGGEISVTSRLGIGSIFSVLLPLPKADAGATQASQATGSRRLQGLRVLAAEDVELNRFVLEDLLMHEGASVVFVENGQEALDQITQRGARSFDVLLTDIQMPVMDGHELARQIRQHHAWLPVIGLTAHAMAEERDRCLESGMVAHVTKPIDDNKLVTAILQCCRTVVSDPGASALAPTETIQGAIAEAENLINWEALAKRYNGRSSFTDKLIGILLRTHSETPEKMRNAAAQGDLETMKFLAHTIKGIAGNLEASTLHTLAIEADHSAKDQQPDAVECTMKLAGALDELLDMLRQRNLRTQTGTVQATAE